MSSEVLRLKHQSSELGYSSSEQLVSAVQPSLTKHEMRAEEKSSCKKELVEKELVEKEQENRLLELLPEVAKVVGHYFRQPDQREDMMQDIAAQLLERQGDFRGESPFEHWALAIASRMCISRLRRQKILRFFSFAEDDPEPVCPRSQDLEQRQREDAEFLHHAIKELSASDRELLTLSDLLDKKDEEVASILNIKAGALRVRKHRARQNLKKILLARGYSYES